MIRGYKRQVLFYFEVYGQRYSLAKEHGHAWIEETRKNGQEDTHFAGAFWPEGGGFTTEDDVFVHGAEYGHDVPGIIAHLNKYGIPEA